YSNMGIALKDKGESDAAIDSYKQAIKIKPDYADAFSNMGIALQAKGELDAAIGSYKQAIKIKPDYAEMHHNLSFAFLNAGGLKEGLDKYEWRWKTAENLSKMRHFSKPLWDGITSLKDKTILLWGEQGPGDVIMWSSCLSLVASQAEKCILECEEKLVPLLARSFPKVEVRAENRSLDNHRDDFDVHLPMGSLFRHFIPEISKKTKPNAFLIPDPVRVNFWKERLNLLGNGPFVGISWKSPLVTPARLPNYTRIPDWAPVLALSDVTFVNLQSSEFKDDLAEIWDEFGVNVHNFDDLDHYNDLDDVAALSASFDVVISVSTAVSTIAAGVGTPTKMLHWRQSSWNNILFTPPGPSVDVFERNTWEPWDDVFQSVAKDIADFQVA
ncbi:MAG: tetratricopeptide repeat protein, partial [Planktomarina sp.]|nr:tetratricopeptide repeat protein [Planktomarina sp.]